MTNQQHHSYLRMREEQERLAAEATQSPEAKLVHLEMAERYADQCWSLDEGYGLHLVRSDS